MALFRIRATETIQIEFDVEADNLEDAIELVEGCEVTGIKREYQTTVTHYAIEGVMGWNKVGESI